jgi:hypothetical protein
MSEWSTRRRVTTHAIVQILLLGMLITAHTIWDLSLSVPSVVAMWAGPALGGLAGIRAASKTAGRAARPVHDEAVGVLPDGGGCETHS